jgi:hypothetical protein
VVVHQEEVMIKMITNMMSNKFTDLKMNTQKNLTMFNNHQVKLMAKNPNNTKLVKEVEVNEEEDVVEEVDAEVIEEVTEEIEVAIIKIIIIMMIASKNPIKKDTQITKMAVTTTKKESINQKRHIKIEIIKKVVKVTNIKRRRIITKKEEVMVIKSEEAME